MMHGKTEHRELPHPVAHPDQHGSIPMTDDRKRNTGGADGLLPLPAAYLAREFVHNTPVYGANQMESYARANVDRALAESRAEVRKLTVKCGILQRAADRYVPCSDCRDKIEFGCCERCARQGAEARAERLAEALGEVEAELGPLVGLDHDQSDPIHRALEAAMAALSLEPNP